MKVACTFVFILLLQSANCQVKVFTKADSLNKKRFLTTSIGITSIWSSSTIALWGVWYSEFEKTPLHSFNDSKNWLQMDKMGHVYSCYHFSELVSKTYRWSGCKPKQAAILGSSIGWGYQFSLEILDGTSSGWGFSWSDVAANTLGSGLYLTQELAFKKQWIKLKFSYRNSGFAPYRPEVLGSNFQERLLKDYNGQTYWLSFSPFAFAKNTKVPKWITLSVGYSAHQKLVGDQEFYTTPDGMHSFESKREFILSFDIDVKELPIKKQWLKTLVSPFNSIKIPFPALVWQGKTLYGRGLY